METIQHYLINFYKMMKLSKTHMKVKIIYYLCDSSWLLL